MQIGAKQRAWHLRRLRTFVAAPPKRLISAASHPIRCIAVGTTATRYQTASLMERSGGPLDRRNLGEGHAPGRHEEASLAGSVIGNIDAIKAEKLTEAGKPTVNRYLALVRAILLCARDEWEWIDKTPKVKLFKEGPGRERSITPEQVV